MRAHQWEASLLAMIELKKLPSVRIVAGLAAGAQSSLMMNVLMARGAGSRSCLILLCNVTALAGHSRVEADQWEGCEVMVEIDFLAPALLRMAAFARRAELALVDVLLFVAADTCCL